MTTKNKTIKKVLILGSNSKVAQSICEELAKSGCNYFYLISRDKIKGEIFANYLIKEFSVLVVQKYYDLLNDESNAIDEQISNGEFDLYLITAGYLGNNLLAEKNNSEASRILNINFNKIVFFINSFISDELIEKKSRLWVFTSVAADLGRPSNYFYGSAKAGLNTFCEGVLLKCQNKPFSVRIIKAGYMDTEMTKGKAPKILCAKTNYIAKRLLKTPDKRGSEYLPFWWGPLMFIIKILPSSIVSKL